MSTSRCDQLKTSLLEDEVAKRIYRAIVRNGDELNITQIPKFIHPSCKHVNFERNGVSSIQRAFLNKYSYLFQMTRKVQQGNYVIRPIVKIEFCKVFDSKQGCSNKDCPKLHVCRHFVKGKCTFGSKCKKPHHFEATQTRRVLKDHLLDELTHADLKNFLCRNVQFALEDMIDASTAPKNLEICKYYNVAIGCSRDAQCPFLHVCRFYFEEQTCKFGVKCIRKHDLNSPHAQSLIARYKMQGTNVFLYLRNKTDNCQAQILNGKSTMENVLGFPKSLVQSYPNLRKSDRPIEEKQRTQSCSLLAKANNNGLQATEPHQLRKYSEPIHPPVLITQEICEKSLRGSCQHFTGCYKKHRALPFSWEYSLRGDAWQAVGKQENIRLEVNFCDAKVTELVVRLGEEQDYVFKFQHWIALQMNNNSLFAGIFNETPMLLQIRRLSTPSSVTKDAYEDSLFLTRWIWYYQDDNGSWKCYDDDDDIFFTAKVNSRMIESAFLQQGRNTFQFQKCGKNLRIDFERMVQEEVDAQGVCDVRRRPMYPRILHAGSHSKSECLAHQRCPFPSYWYTGVRDGAPGKECELMDLSLNPDEYRNVYHNFITSMHNCRIEWIKAVKNPSLWMKFAKKKEELTKIGSSYLKELQLYRNANSSNAERICINGFGQGTFDVHSTNGMRETLYFAKEADVANRGNTMNRCGGYYMILCRVLVTVASGMLENVNMISEMNGTNGFQDYSIVPVRDYDRVYPEFVIMFTV